MSGVSDDIQLTAPGPGPVLGISAQIVGPTGLNTFYYWWVAHYPVGVSVVSTPLLVRSAPTLTATNYVTVTGQSLIGATSYDLLRTTSPQLPSAAANIAVATGLTSPTFNDQGAALTSYNVAGLAAGAPVSEFISLNNRDFAQPTLVVSPFGLAVPSVTFPDGTTQNTAGGGPAGSITPSWHNYTVTLVPPNWVVTSPGLPNALISTAAALTQDIPLQVLPANAFVLDIRSTLLLGPPGGAVATAFVTGVGSKFDAVTNPNGSNSLFASPSLNLFNPPPSNTTFVDVPSTTGASTLSPATLTATVTTTVGNINLLAPPCQFKISVLWGVTG